MPAALSSRRRPRRRTLVVLLVLVALVVPVSVLLSMLLRPAPSEPSSASVDDQALVTDVSYTAEDTSFTVASVVAVTQNGDGLLRLRLQWVDDPDDSSGLVRVPAFSAEVLHREPYAGLTSTCGLGTPVDVLVTDASTTVDLPCKGLLVPADVASVTLRD